MEPRIQYAKTTDGVSIAFWVAGRGPPIVWVPDPPFSIPPKGMLDLSPMMAIILLLILSLFVTSLLA